MRLAQGLLFFAYVISQCSGPGAGGPGQLVASHHRVVSFHCSDPGLTVSAFWQSSYRRAIAGACAEPVAGLGCVSQAPGFEDRRMRLLTLAGGRQALERRFFELQRGLLTSVLWHPRRSMASAP